jgi:hypothetical protein
MAIIATGKSLEGFDFSSINGVKTIGVNESMKINRSDYHVIADNRVVRKVFTLLDDSTTYVIARNVANELRYAPPIDPLRDINARDEFAKRKVVECKIGETGDLWMLTTVVTAALSLAHHMGADEVFLLGVDLYRSFDSSYVYDIGVAAPESLEEIPGRAGEYCTPAFRSMVEAFERGVRERRWGDMKIRNMNPRSLVECFDKPPFR